MFDVNDHHVSHKYLGLVIRSFEIDQFENYLDIENNLRIGFTHELLSWI